MSWVSDLLVRIRGDKTQLDSTLAGAKTSLNSFGNIVTKIGGILGVAFGIHAIVNFTKECMRLAGEAEGVKNAFAKIGDPRLLEGLKKATRGVIEESDLMQLAVKAKSFNIPLKDLATYLEFATNKAIELNKPIGEMADLIVTGLGRGSTASRSLVQLGISTNDYKEALKTTGGVLALINSKLAEMGDVADTASIRYGKFTTNIKELKIAFGELINNSKIINKIVSDATIAITKVPENKKIGFWQTLFLSNDDILKLKKQQEIVDNLIAARPKETTVPGQIKEIETLTILNTRLKEYKAELDEIDITDKNDIQNQLDKIAALEYQIKLLNTIQPLLPKKGETPFTTPALRSKVSITGIDKNWKDTYKQGIIPIAPQKFDILKPDDLLALTGGLISTQDAVNGLATSFETLFTSASDGFQNMMNGIIKGLERLAAELVAKAVIFTILNTIFPGSGTFMNFAFPSFKGNLGSGTTSGTIKGLSKLGMKSGSDQLLAQLSGKNIDIILKRFYEDNG